MKGRIVVKSWLGIPRDTMIDIIEIHRNMYVFRYPIHGDGIMKKIGIPKVFVKIQAVPKPQEDDMIRRGERVEVNNRVYIQFDNQIQVFEQRPDFQVFLHAFSCTDADAADMLIADLRASGCTGKGDCHTKPTEEEAEAHGW